MEKRCSALVESTFLGLGRLPPPGWWLLLLLAQLLQPILLILPTLRLLPQRLLRLPLTLLGPSRFLAQIDQRVVFLALPAALD